MMMEHPFVPKEGVTPRYLYFACDRAPLGSPDHKEFTIYLLAYFDLMDQASGFADVLPAYFSYFYSEEIAKKWFHVAALEKCRDVTFNTDEDGAWDGTWMTSDDQQISDWLVEDIYMHPDKLKLSNLNLVQNQPRVMMTAEQLDSGSMLSFSERPAAAVATGRPPPMGDAGANAGVQP
jgi:hypothetical protein